MRSMVGVCVRDLCGSRWVSLVGNEFRHKGRTMSLLTEGLEGDKSQSVFGRIKLDAVM
jgi:hypothetical protein